MAIEQANTKGWNNTTKWLLEKLQEEYDEFTKAIKKRDERQIPKEFADLLIVAFQLVHNEARNFDLDEAFIRKIDDNYKNKKKTWDDKLQRIVRK